MQALVNALEAQIVSLRQLGGERGKELAEEIGGLSRDFANTPNSEPVKERVVRMAGLVVTFVQEQRIGGVNVGRLSELFRAEQKKLVG